MGTARASWMFEVASAGKCMKGKSMRTSLARVIMAYESNMGSNICSEPTCLTNICGGVDSASDDCLKRGETRRSVFYSPDTRRKKAST